MCKLVPALKYLTSITNEEHSLYTQSKGKHPKKIFGKINNHFEKVFFFFHFIPPSRVFDLNIVTLP